MKSGIYLIKNMINGKVYVGSTVNAKRRKYSHFTALRKNKHHNAHLQFSFNKYGEENFEYYIITYCHVNILLQKEDFYINYYKSMDRCFGYNINTAERHGTSDSTKRKISESLMGNKNPNYNKPMPEETKRKISEALMGRKNSNYNKPMSEETKLKLSKSVSAAMKGVPKSEEHKKNLSKALSGENHPCYGIPKSDETKEKISKALSGKKYRPRTEEHKKNLADRKSVV
jgi:group I intron endonuclease